MTHKIHTKISTSPHRNTFQRNKYLERMAKEGRTADNDSGVKAMMDYYKNWHAVRQQDQSDPEWAKHNLEYDLRSTDWVLGKTRNSKAYAQNLYAALCNNEFRKNEVWPVLKNQTWSCSWRYAGGIIADMLEQGDYIDWYCSGIRNDLDDSVKEGWSDLERKEYENTYSKYVGEGCVTEEIRNDLLKLGWSVVNEANDV